MSRHRALCVRLHECANAQTLLKCVTVQPARRESVNWYPNGAARCQPYRQRLRAVATRVGDVPRGSENRYQRLAVTKLAGVSHPQDVPEGQPMDLEDLVLFGAWREPGQPRGEEQVDDFCKNAGGAQVVAERLPRACGAPASSSSSRRAVSSGGSRLSILPAGSSQTQPRAA